MLVRLTAKLADVMDGVDVTHCEEGDVIDLIDRDARMLIAEGWAERAADEERVSCTPAQRAAVAADTPLPALSANPVDQPVEHMLKGLKLDNRFFVEF